MPCYKPISAWRSAAGAVEFVDRGSGDPLSLACGQCVGCRLERSRQWAVRCMHEASLHSSNWFLTLTYRDAPKYGLRYRDFQLFMRRLRRRRSDVRFYMCGEYGSLTGRAHFHAALFNVDFPDRRYWRKAPCGEDCFRSAELERIWPQGHSELGSLTFESASYIARYIVGKRTGEEDCYYDVLDPDTGEVWRRTPEFNRMSLNPAIGRDWLRLYWSDVRSGRVVVNGHEATVPKYYRRYLSKTDYVASASFGFGHAAVADMTPARLADREEVAKARLAFLKRSFDPGDSQ